MRKECRLRKRTEFARVYKSGRSLAGKHLVVYELMSEGRGLRIGVSAGKKLGNAVTRNRVKRVIREAARSLLGDIEQGYDLVIIGRAGAKQAKMQEVRADLAKVLKRLGRLVSTDA